jgi:hypothetical protein|tara:strand:- start:635 stop:952 length:318 start_codon:yes stop_codon:yes gene_type:complete
MVDEVIVKSTGEVVKRTLTADEETAWNNRQPSNAYKLEAIRHIRKKLLQETDIWVLKGNITTAQSNYRQALRDIPSNYDSSKYNELLERDDSDGSLKHSVWTKPS